jgi:hypothetical protein
MAEPTWEKIKQAVDDLNRGETSSILRLCSEGLVLHLGQVSNRPIGTTYYGSDAVRELWHETVEGFNGALEVMPLRYLSDGRHLVLFVEAALGSGTERRNKRVIFTGAVGTDGRCKELWVEFDDQPVSEAFPG